MAGKAPQGPTRSRLCLPKTGHGNSVTDTIVDNRERHYIYFVILLETEVLQTIEIIEINKIKILG